MRAARFSEHGGPDVLQVEEVDRPEPGHGEVLVAVEAAGVNPVDTYFREGEYDPAGVPFTPGVDLAGVIEAVGDGVSAFEEGDRVFGTGIGNGEYQGAYAEYALAPAERLAHLPEGVDVRQAGAAGVAGFTAWRALIEHADLSPAESCLIHGGSGGVGHVALQLALAAGARTYATSNPKYFADLKEHDVERVFNYDYSALTERVKEVTGGVDVILDHRLDEYLQFDADVAATGARVVGIGENDPHVELTNDGVARSKDVSYRFMSMFNAPDFRGPLESLAYLMETGDIEIEIEETYGLADAGEAQRKVIEDSFLGKLVIEP